MRILFASISLCKMRDTRDSGKGGIWCLNYFQERLLDYNLTAQFHLKII